MAKKASHKGKGYYAQYKGAGIFFANKKRKARRHLKAHPDDAQAREYKADKARWSRKTPTTRVWRRSKELKAYAHTLRELGYSGSEIQFLCFRRSKPVAAEVGEDG